MGQGTGKGNGSVNDEVATVAEEKSAELEWPAHFPDGCPASCKSEDTNGVVYRLLREPRNPADTRSWLEKGQPSSYSDCERAALSCCRTLEDIVELRKANGHFRKRKIASVELTPVHGKIAQTGSPGHHSLWLRRVYLAQHDALFVVRE